MDIESNLEQFIVDELLVGSKGMKLDYDQSLISSGVIDSLAILRLITFIEQKFGVTVEDEDVVPDNFETINIITNYVKAKM
jgi:acyl carrier protein